LTPEQPPLAHSCSPMLARKVQSMSILRPAAWKI
jgi:hypothetical protein